MISFAALVLAGSVTVSGEGPRVISPDRQDMAWRDTPEACHQFRIDHILLPALERLRADPNGAFLLGSTRDLMELLEGHPEIRGEVIQRMKEGRLDWSLPPRCSLTFPSLVKSNPRNCQH